MHSSSLCW